jgi:hypothetical protein
VLSVKYFIALERASDRGAKPSPCEHRQCIFIATFLSPTFYPHAFVGKLLSPKQGAGCINKSALPRILDYV